MKRNGIRQEVKRVTRLIARGKHENRIVAADRSGTGIRAAEAHLARLQEQAKAYHPMKRKAGKNRGIELAHCAHQKKAKGGKAKAASG